MVYAADQSRPGRDLHARACDRSCRSDLSASPIASRCQGPGRSPALKPSACFC